MALLCLIAAWFLATGVFEVVAAIRLRHYIPAWWALALSGVLSVILAVALAMMPLAGLVVLAWWAGASWVAFGIVLLGPAFRLRSLARHAPRSVHVPVS